MKGKHDRNCKGAWETGWQADIENCTLWVLAQCKLWLGEQLECDIIELGFEGCEKWEKTKPPGNAVCVFFSACGLVLKRASSQMLGPEGRHWAMNPSTFWVTGSKLACSMWKALPSAGWLQASPQSVNGIGPSTGCSKGTADSRTSSAGPGVKGGKCPPVAQQRLSAQAGTPWEAVRNCCFLIGLDGKGAVWCLRHLLVTHSSGLVLWYFLLWMHVCLLQINII